MSPNDEQQKTVNDVRLLVGGALRAGIFRMEDEGRRVRESQGRPRRDHPFRPCLAFRVSQPGLLLRSARNLRRSKQGAKGVAQRQVSSEERKAGSVMAQLVLFVYDSRV